MRKLAMTIGMLLLGSCAVDTDDPVPSAAIPEPVDSAPVKVQLSEERASLVDAYLNRPAEARRLHESHSPFAEKMRMFQEDFLPLDEVGLTRESTIIVRGTIEEVIDGRTIDFRRGASNPMVTSVLIVSVEKAIKGDVGVGDRLFVDVYRSPVVSSAELNATKPEAPVTMFLKPAHFNHDLLKYEINDAIKGEELLKLRTPQGLWVPESERVEQPLSADPVFTDGVVRSQEESETAIAAIVAAQGG